jgi:purine nucleosidase/pyrimidine-specific ribonucleoside hydrolase
MKRKFFVILGIVLGVLALLLILIWPAAPLWARLGLEPFCIQGNWPHLQFVSCPPRAAASSVVTPRPLSSLPGQSPIPVIVDDDGSPDGMLALLYFLRNPLFEVKAVTISCGEAHPELFAPHILQILAGLGRGNIPVGVGRATPLEGNNAFPDPWRQASDDFWGIAIPAASVSLEPVRAAELIVETLHNSTRPVMVFVSGNHTNLAEALRLDPGIAEHIREVRIMGGSIRVRGNIKHDWPAIDNSVAEWNIWVDPVAADEVFASGLSLHLMPLDATNQIALTQADARYWADSGTPAGALAGDLLQWMLDSWSSTGVYIWDLATAVEATDPALCPEVPLAVDILVAPGPDLGRTVITDQTPNVSVCLDPDPGQIQALARAILGR